MAGTFTVTGLSAGLPSGSKTVGPLTITGSSVVGEILDAALSAGANTFTVPTGSVAVLIVPPATNTQTLTVKTSANSGDTGMPISASDPLLYSYRGLSVTSITIGASGAVSPVELSFI